MKLLTIHSNIHGDVLNPSSATGFRVEDDAGRWLEVRQCGDSFTVSTQQGGVCPKCSGTGFKNAKCPACGEGPFGRPADARGDVRGLDAVREVLAEMRERKINHGRDTSPTLIEWADRIERAITTPPPASFALYAQQFGRALRPPASREGVRRLVAKWRRESEKMQLHPAGLAARRVCAVELESALAAGEVEQRAQHEQQDKTGGAPVVRRDDALLEELAKGDRNDR